MSKSSFFIIGNFDNTPSRRWLNTWLFANINLTGLLNTNRNRLAQVNLELDKTQIFIQNYTNPINVVVIGAVHITQYLVEFAKNLNFEITIIDPRSYFTSENRFKDVKIINDWPSEAFKKIETNSNTALVALTHDPKIDDPSLQYALKNKFFYIGALGSKKTHINRCERLRELGFAEKEISSIHGPIGIKLGGKSSSEIALSIISQLVSESNKS